MSVAAPAARPLPRGPGVASDAELVRRVRDGDDDAFEELFLRHRPAVLGYARGILGHREHAEDAAQEAFVSALRRLRATEGPIDLRPWLRTIVRNACVDQWRRSQRRGEAHLEVEVVMDAGGGQATSAPSGPEHRTDEREALGHLVSALGELPERQQRMLVMRELEGRSYEEIAALQGTTRSAVEAGLFRARQTVGTNYRDLRSGERCAATAALARDACAGRLGLRERRRLTGHLRDCARCRREAALLGVPSPLLGTSRLRGAAALLPLPLLRWGGLLGSGGGSATGGSASMGAGLTASPSVVGGIVPGVLAGTGLLLGGVGAVGLGDGDGASRSVPAPPAVRAEASPTAGRTPELRLPDTSSSGTAGEDAGSSPSRAGRERVSLPAASTAVAPVATAPAVAAPASPAPGPATPASAPAQARPAAVDLAETPAGPALAAADAVVDGVGPTVEGVGSDVGETTTDVGDTVAEVGDAAVQAGAPPAVGAATDAVDGAVETTSGVVDGATGALEQGRTGGA